MEKKTYKPTIKDWCLGIGLCVLLIVFLVWVRSWIGIIALPFIFDAYVTRKINWGWWKELENPVTRTIMSWVDAIVFALVAVYFVNIYFFQNYTIPSSSLEKSLLIGDYLYVSKTSYGARAPMTPLSMTLSAYLTYRWAEELHLVAPMGVQAYLAQADTSQRYCGVQLSFGGYRVTFATLSGCRLLYAQLSIWSADL